MKSLHKLRDILGTDVATAGRRVTTDEVVQGGESSTTEGTKTKFLDDRAKAQLASIEFLCTSMSLSLTIRNKRTCETRPTDSQEQETYEMGTAIAGEAAATNRRAAIKEEECILTRVIRMKDSDK